MPTLTELLGDKLLEHTTSNGVRQNSFITTSELNGKVIGLYFSGHWCPPSREFTPRLVQAYKSIICEVKNQFEIVFISWDQSQQEFDGYFAEMPWKALAYAERTRQDNLTAQFNVTGIPRLVILSPTCQIITTTGVQDIYSNGIENIRKWSANAQQIIVSSTEQIEPCLTGVRQVRITHTQYSRQWTSSSGGQQACISGSAEQQANSSSSSSCSAEQQVQQASCCGGGGTEHHVQLTSGCGGGGGSTEYYVQQASSCSGGGGSIEHGTLHTQQQASSGSGSIERRTQHTVQQVSSSDGGSIEHGTLHAQQQASSRSGNCSTEKRTQQVSSSGGSSIERRIQHTQQQVSSSGDSNAEQHTQQQASASSSTGGGSIIERRTQRTLQQVSSSGDSSAEQHTQQQASVSSSSGGGSIIERRTQQTIQQISSSNTEQHTADSNEFIDTNVKTKTKAVVIPKKTVTITKQSDEEVAFVSQKEKRSKKSKSRFYLLLAGVICIALLLLALLLLFIIYKMVPRLRKTTIIAGKSTFTDVEDINVRAVFSTDYVWKNRNQSQIITDLDNLADQINAKLSANKVRILKAYFTNYRLSKNYRRFVCQDPLLGNILQLHLLASFVGQCEYDDYVCKSISKEKLKNGLIEFLHEAINIYFGDDRIVKTNIKFCTFADTLDIENVNEEEEEDPPKQIVVIPTLRLPVPTPPPRCVVTPITIVSVFIAGQDSTEIRDDRSYNHPSTAVTFHDNSVNRLRLQLSCDQRNDDEFSCNRVYFVETSIDLNNDGRFDELENRIHPRSLLYSEISQGLFQFEISIPSIDGTKVQSGLHRMRLRVYPGKEFRKNCGTNEYAATREYQVNIIPKPVQIETVHVQVQPQPQPQPYIQPAPLILAERNFVCAPNVEQIKWVLAGGELGTQIRDSSSYTNPVTKEITFFGDAVYLIRVELDCRAQSDSDCTRGHHVDIFLDLNNDGQFEQGENRVFRRTYIAEETPDNTFDLQILIPPIDERTVKTGLHRMRLTLMRSETYQKQCGRTQDSIVREYMVNIIPRKSCQEREYAIRPQPDLEQESEQEPDYVVQLSADFSSRPYCSAGNFACSVGNTGIYSVQLSGERNTMINDDMRSCRAVNNYEDRSQLMVDLFEATTYSLRIQFHCTESDNCDSIYYLGAWIDFNNDGNFDEIGERLIDNYQIDSFSYRRDYDLNIRISQLDNQNYRDGTHRMRIVLAKNENGLKPCFSSGYGEVRDYTVHVLPKEYY